MDEEKCMTDCLNWFLSFISPESWRQRKSRIENALSEGILNSKNSSNLIDMATLAYHADRFGWYLYLLEVSLTDIPKYEHIQGARVLPVFFRLGEDLELVKKIGGIETKVKQLHKQSKNALTDSIIFEILCALAWVKNGWTVAFMPESPPDKTPDFLARKGDESWYVECKRLSQSSEYSIDERERWLKMLNYIKDDLIQYNIVLDITFHVELKSLPESYAKDELIGKLKLLPLDINTVIVSNQTWTVEVTPVDMVKVKDHLKLNFVKNASPQLAELIGGKRADSAGFSSGCSAKYVSINGGIYIEDIDRAFGVHWNCDAPVAIQTKARDIRRQLSDATNQLPEDKNSAVHIGVETLDGPTVEKERYNRIFNTATLWDTKGKKLRWIYCHFFQSYSPPDQPWIIDETISWFSRDITRKNEPLKNRFLIIPEDIGEDSEVHWNKDKP